LDNRSYFVLRRRQRYWNLGGKTMPLGWDAPQGAGGSGTRRWRPSLRSVGGGDGGGGGGSSYDPMDAVNAQISNQQALQSQAQAHDEAMVRLGADLNLRNARERNEQVGALNRREVDLKGRWDRDKGDQDTWNKGGLLRQAGVEAAKAKPAVPTPEDKAAKTAQNNWFALHTPNVEGVISQAGLNPQAADALRLGVKNKDPEVMQAYGPAFSQYANRPGILDRTADVVMPAVIGAGKAVREAVFPSNPTLRTAPGVIDPFQ